MEAFYCTVYTAGNADDKANYRAISAYERNEREAREQEQEYYRAVAEEAACIQRLRVNLPA